MITMGCNVNCISLPCRYREDWGLEDPTGKDDETFLHGMEIIKNRVEELRTRIRTGDLRTVGREEEP